MRILGLDIGEKTIGVAVSDPLGFTAQGICTIKRQGLNKDLEEIKKYVLEYSCELIVVGLPKNMNGTIGPSGEKVLKLSKKIEDYIGVKVDTWDERLTTVAAHKAMLEADLSRNKRKRIVDKLAAMYILQGYLDRMSKS
ncbi:MAG: Holliday junction resolvase RuvX [Clostridiales bacterium]|uniref:Holliday junction resolvase RuvX n=1 Tax=Clostridium sp. N3C TaxID=1776758 RepID=UPI00092E0132|nr:Holliday junction resolvase RuvX [Clostridium sp. N3C]NLZ48676.1 Holliday junction resolvase RuvX [Clostridiales bacterium]SCN22138.1 putative Holliday junction resolvase [Clostridium sp. N3C]